MSLRQSSKLSPKKTLTKAEKQDYYKAKLQQIINFRKKFSILKRRDSSLFKTDVDTDKKVTPGPL